jgi:hypothetical protein
MLVSRIYNSKLAVMGDVNCLVKLRSPKRKMIRQCPKCGGQFRKLKRYNGHACVVQGLTDAVLVRMESAGGSSTCKSKLPGHR